MAPQRMFKVLIADDENAVCEGLSLLIPWDRYNFEVAGYAHDGKEALEKIQRDHFDLLIIDIRMPKYDGIEVLRQMRSLGHNERAIVISAYKEFEYAKQAIQYGVKEYILKPVDEVKLAGLIASISREISESIAVSRMVDHSRKVLIGETLLSLVEKGAGGGTAERMAELNIGIKGKLLYACIAYAGEGAKEQDAERLADGIEGVLQSHGCGYAFRRGDSVCAILNFTPGNFYLKEKIESELYEALRRQGPGGAVLALGSLAGSVGELRRSYAQAGKVLKWAVFSGRPGILHHEQLNLATDIRMTTLLGEFEELKRVMGSGDNDGALRQIDRFFGFMELESLSVELVYGLCLQIMQTMREMLEKIGEGSESVTKLQEEPGMDRMNAKELQRFIRSTYLRTAERAAIIRNRKRNRVIDRVLDYVDENYDQDFGLNDLSRMFHINGVYLGKLFHEATGMHFQAYRNRLRIRKACSLLETTDLKVYEISERVGYSDINYFHTVFKENVGVSPDKYRRRT